MTFEQILALLMASHPGARKDVLANIARNIAMVAKSEDNAKELIEGVTGDKVSAFTKEFRSSIDREVTEANQTAEKRLREKYEFVDKVKKDDLKPCDPGTGLSENPEIAELTKQIQALTGIVTGMATERTTTTRKSQIEEVLKDVKDQSYKDMILSNFGYMSFADDAKFVEYKDALTKTVAEKVQQQADDGLRNTGGRINFGKVDTDGVSSGVAAYVKDKTADSGGNLGGKSL